MINHKALDFIKNFSYTVVANFISLIVSTLVVFLVPRLIGVEDYGYWQLFLFYSSYVGFLHFGWNDGMYLRYGGQEYEELDKRLFFSQFYMLVMLQLVIALVIVMFSRTLLADLNRVFIWQMVGLYLIVTNLRYMLLFILQCTNRIKEYAQVTMVHRILYGSLVVLFFLVGAASFKWIVIADIVSGLISLLHAMYFCREIVFRKVSTFYFDFTEAFRNISVGVKLMFANIASMLILGVVRFGIERSWDVATFGKVSLTLSISNLLMLFVNAVGVIMFPILRRTDQAKLGSIYVTIRDLLMAVLLGLLLFYYPLRLFLGKWLPQYEDSLMYMALVFPMIVYEGKVSLLVNTYLKTLRKEKTMLRVNLTLLVVSLITTILTTVVFKNLTAAIGSIAVVLALRCAYAELALGKVIGISLKKDVFLELGVTFIFMITGWFLNLGWAVALYALTYAFYLVTKRNDLKITISNLKSFFQ